MRNYPKVILSFLFNFHNQSSSLMFEMSLELQLKYFFSPTIEILNLFSFINSFSWFLNTEILSGCCEINTGLLVWGSAGPGTRMCTIKELWHYSFGCSIPRVTWPHGVSATSWVLGFAVRSSILETAWGLSVGFVRNQGQRVLVTVGIQIPWLVKPTMIMQRLVTGRVNGELGSLFALYGERQATVFCG